MKPHFRLLILDIDGVLTDGTVSVLGDERRILLRDLDALSKARKAGIEVAFLTGESEASASCLVERCGGGRAWYEGKDKATALETMSAENGISLNAVCYVADADRDAVALRRAGLGLAPADASLTAKEAADRVLFTSGGRGVVEEVVNMLLADVEREAEECVETAAADVINAELGEVSSTMAVLAKQDNLALIRAAGVIAEALVSGSQIFLCGNGGSSSLAQHAAAEMVGRFALERRPLPAVALTADSAVILALGNDYGFERVFERQVEALVQQGDVVVGMSTSGCSDNVARALFAGRRVGAQTIALVGASPGPVGKAAGICVGFPSTSTARVQEMHLAALHAICRVVEARTFALKNRGKGSRAWRFRRGS